MPALVGVFSKKKQKTPEEKNKELEERKNQTRSQFASFESKLFAMMRSASLKECRSSLPRHWGAPKTIVRCLSRSLKASERRKQRPRRHLQLASAAAADDASSVVDRESDRHFFHSSSSSLLFLFIFLLLLGNKQKAAQSKTKTKTHFFPFISLLSKK